MALFSALVMIFIYQINATIIIIAMRISRIHIISQQSLIRSTNNATRHFAGLSMAMILV
jgi:hypothetical protein